ncbi:CoA transferase, partial [Bradyrhizobium sp.]|uniref:CoA transferase n=1 Tax=Bradyrhizobium sp. TaxID=376 RepID=UPI003C761660
MLAHCAGDGDNKPGSPRRARRKPLKPLRREGREFRRTCGDYACVLFHFCTQGCGCVRRARLSLRPPFSGGKCRCQSRTQSAPRDHERIPEIGSTAFPVGKGSDKIAYVSQGLPMQTPREILADLWILAGGDPAALNSVALTGEEPQLPSSFRVAAAAQTSIAAAGLAAAQLWKLRSGKNQKIAVDMRHAVVECRSERYLGVEGTPPPPAWDAIAGVYKTRDHRFVRLHTNFTHHRDAVCRVLGCKAEHNEVQAALMQWDAESFETAAYASGGVVAMMRSHDEWSALPQAKALAALPVMTIEKIGDAAPKPWPGGDRPLAGLRVLD